MHDDTWMMVLILFLSVYALAGTIFYIVQSARNFIKNYRQLEASLAAVEDYAADIEEEKNELAAGYSTMATTIETLQGEMEALIAHTENHCQRLDLLEQGRPVRIRFAVMPELNYEDYQSEEPYSESDCPTLPLPVTEWVTGEELKGLDTL